MVFLYFLLELTVMITDMEEREKKESRDDKRIMDRSLLNTKRPCHATPNQLIFHICSTFFLPSAAVDYYK